MRTNCALACLCLLPNFSLAQDGIIKNFDAAALERFIQDDLKKTFTKTENKQIASVYYVIKDTPYYVTFNGKQKFVLFFEKGQAGNLTLQKVNDWNRDAIFSRAYLQNNMYALEVPLSIGTGVTRETLKYFFDRFEAELKKFKGNLAP